MKDGFIMPLNMLIEVTVVDVSEDEDILYKNLIYPKKYCPLCDRGLWNCWGNCTYETP